MIDFHPGASTRAAPRPGRRPPRARDPRPAERPTVPPVILRVGERLDMAELRRLRGTLSGGEGPASVELDFSPTRAADGDAVLLLEGDISRLASAGTQVKLRGLSPRLHVQLYLHPILRFAVDADDLFTDPDLDWPGFRASRH